MAPVLAPVVIRSCFSTGRRREPAQVGTDHLQRRCLRRVEQGGDESMGFPIARTRGVRQRVDEHTHEQMVAAFAPLRRGRVDVGPVRAVRQQVARAQRNMGGNPSPHVRAPCMRASWASQSCRSRGREAAACRRTRCATGVVLPHVHWCGRTRSRRQGARACRTH